MSKSMEEIFYGKSDESSDLNGTTVLTGSSFPSSVGSELSSPIKSEQEKPIASSMEGRMYGDPRPEHQEVDPVGDESPEDNTEIKLFGETHFAENGPYGVRLKPGLERMAEAYGMEPEAINESRTETAKIFHELEVDPQLGERFHTLFSNHVTAIPDDYMVSTWEQEARTKLQERFGSEADARVSAARQYLDGKPKLSAALHMTGLGSHPEVVVELAERAWRLKQAGKLK